jgi:transketolase
LQEGQNWKIMYASAKKVDNLIATIDLNGKQNGSTDEVLAMEVFVQSLKPLTDVIDIKEGKILKR